MPWSENAHMSRSRFVADFESCLYTMTELCERHGISRKTGYKWAERYGSQGAEGLKDRSRAPNHRPTQTPAEVADRLVELRRKHPNLGPRKVGRLAQEARARASLAGGKHHRRVLKREGLVTALPAALLSAFPPLSPAALPYPHLLYRVPRGEFPGRRRRLQAEATEGRGHENASLGSIAADAPGGRAMRPRSRPGRHGAELPAFRPGLWEFKRRSREAVGRRPWRTRSARIRRKT